MGTGYIFIRYRRHNQNNAFVSYNPVKHNKIILLGKIFRDVVEPSNRLRERF